MSELLDIADPVARRAERNRLLDAFAATLSPAELADLAIPFFTGDATLQLKEMRRKRREQSVIEGQRAGLAGKALHYKSKRMRLAGQALFFGVVNLRFRVLNRRNHQSRLLFGDRRDV